MSKPCQEAIELMNLYLDGRLSGGQYQELAKHLEECEHCRKRMNYLRVISSELRTDRPAAPADLHSKIMDHIQRADDQAGESALPQKKRKALGRLTKPLAVCAAALLLLVAAPFALKVVSDRQMSGTSGIAGDGSWFDRLFANGNTANGEGLETDEETADDSSTTDGAALDDTQSANRDPASGNSQNAAAYPMPKLHTNEVFADYIVATGTAADLQQYFSLESVTVYPEDGSVYVYLPNTAGSLARAYTGIRNMGLTLQLNLTDVPEKDHNAPEILLIILPN